MWYVLASISAFNVAIIVVFIMIFIIFLLDRKTKSKSKIMSNEEMLEKIKSERPSNYFKLTPERQWEIDKELGILDWVGKDLSKEDKERFKKHYQ